MSPDNLSSFLMMTGSVVPYYFARMESSSASSATESSEEGSCTLEELETFWVLIFWLMCESKFWTSLESSISDKKIFLGANSKSKLIFHDYHSILMQKLSNHQFLITSWAYGQKIEEGGSTWVESTCISGFLANWVIKTSLSISKNSSKVRYSFPCSLRWDSSFIPEFNRDYLYFWDGISSAWGL